MSPLDSVLEQEEKRKFFEPKGKGTQLTTLLDRENEAAGLLKSIILLPPSRYYESLDLNQKLSNSCRQQLLVASLGAAQKYNNNKACNNRFMLQDNSVLLL